ncbi:MAG TPA: response regulator [bacterium]|nr:response regulator [bacterium]
MKNALVVDDIAYTRLLYGKALKKLGFAIVEAENGAAAVRAALSQAPDLILLDLNLPDISGLEVLQTLRQQKLTVPVMVITANEDRDLVMKLVTLGISDYLIKPVDIFELQKRVARVTGLVGAEGATPAAAAAEPTPARPAPAGAAGEDDDDDD